MARLVLVEESARAILDGNIVESYPALATMGPQPHMDWSNPALARRVINALYRRGDVDSAATLATYAINPDLPTPIRLEALRDLTEWEEPYALDRVNGMWRPIAPRALASSIGRASVVMAVFSSTRAFTRSSICSISPASSGRVPL